MPIPVEEATAGRPVAMYLACKRRRWGGFRYVLVVFDLDASRGGRAKVLADAAALKELLAACGIACVPVASGPSGGMHLWAGCPQGLTPAMVRRIAEAAARLFPTLDISPLTNPVSGAVRPPGALHRHGGYARLTLHTAGEAVAVLQKGAGDAAWAALLSTLEGMAGAPALLAQDRARPAVRAVERVHYAGQPVPPSVADRGPVVRPIGTDEAGRVKLAVPFRPLGPKALAGLARRPDNRPGAHSTAVRPVLRSMALAGWSYTQMCQAADDPDLTPALEWLRTAGDEAGPRHWLSGAEAQRRAERAWWLAVQDAARMPRRPADDQETADELTPGAQAAADLMARLKAADPERWARPSGPADRNLLRAVAWLMAVSGCDEVSADVRRLAVLMGRSKSTAALAIKRVQADGWLERAGESLPEEFVAGRVRVAKAHECTGDAHHACAVHQAPPVEPVTGTDVTQTLRAAVSRHFAETAPASQKTPGHHGSDGTRYTPPLGGVYRGLLAELSRAIVHQQSGLWQALGHHAGRTLEALQAGCAVEELPEVTGYTRRTLTRHIGALTGLQLVILHRDPRGRTVAVRTARSLYDAAAQLGTATRPGERALSGYVDRLRYAWWLREASWCALSRAEKRKAGRRAEPGQLVVAGCDPHARAYPRTADGEADHGRAWDLEALRIDALALAQAADALAQAGQVIDTARLPQLAAQAAAGRFATAA
ncbi:hypothetical protein [Kitasatospora sp. NBC_01302]|uniref:hypothetical protein n=1 Tax=Kitasatospora sp. NBC_01302 TaxID=2903575 RepID=UPI002E0D3F83|nr:hypothetical protein OG294_40805 [Kitasatospora sp. NBC_01302]